MCGLEREDNESWALLKVQTPLENGSAFEDVPVAPGANETKRVYHPLWQATINHPINKTFINAVTQQAYDNEEVSDVDLRHAVRVSSPLYHSACVATSRGPIPKSHSIARSSRTW